MSFRLPTYVANSVANRSVVAFGLTRSAQFTLSTVHGSLRPEVEYLEVLAKTLTGGH